MGPGIRIYSFAPLAGTAASATRPDWRRIADLGFDAVHWPAGGDDWAGQAESAGLAAMGEISAHGHVITEISQAVAKGFRLLLCRQAQRVPATVWRVALAEARASRPGIAFCAEALARPDEEVWSLKPARFDYLASSIGWWNGRDAWHLQQQERYRRIGASLGFPVLDAGLGPEARVRRYAFAALLSSAVLMPAGLETGVEDRIRSVNRAKAATPAANQEVPLAGGVNWVVRGEGGALGALIWAANPHSADVTIDLDSALARLPGAWDDADDAVESNEQSALMPQLTLRAGDWRAIRVAPPAARREGDLPARNPAEPPSRIIIERLEPDLDGGRHPLKRIQGDALEISADIFRDGHDRIRAALRVQQQGESDWVAVPFAATGNDRWTARITLTQMGDARFAIEAWTDHFGSWQEEVRKKRDAGRGLRLELVEGRELLAAAAQRAPAAVKPRLTAYLARLDSLGENEPAQAAFLLSPLVAGAVQLAPDRSDRKVTEPQIVSVDRPGARFAAWYEMFPRSQGTSAERSATFDDCARRLPEIRGLGFDVIYFVPIHPIGEVNRKGRNNHPAAQPGEPGSPYAIGSRWGGHTAIEPGLGSLDDFRRFQAQVREHGMELALDFAVQCAPDHPWLKEHLSWFKWRPDGSIEYAENPPKKYEDIVNVDFDGPDWRSLWQALLDAVRFWMNEGVRIFRVDNPHTKPVAFWEWMIGEVRRTDPDVLFLAEAFTRPKMMRLLAKAGFNQSYTYFTWRNTKGELTEYLTELTRSEMVQYYRPNFFPSTPDILPFYLQTGGRAGFRIRLTLAATLSGVYGLYNGFELCEARALPGREEYQDSEKYEFKAWDWNRPGHIKDDIARLNRLRHRSPALQLFDNLRFHESSHGDVLFYSKITPDRRDRILIAVTLDPHQPARTELVFPLSEMGLAPDAGFVTEELFSGWKQEWTGPRHTIEINPGAQPALVWRVL
ncbi:MAG TPA: alpha-1,4-glucan--maltose-1-phosphate maltosyltransferase [Opitutaceae bacterium]|jgi:starch synthase (maltosyl-transferring)